MGRTNATNVLSCYAEGKSRWIKLKSNDLCNNFDICIHYLHLSINCIYSKTKQTQSQMQLPHHPKTSQKHLCWVAQDEAKVTSASGHRPRHHDISMNNYFDLTVIMMIPFNDINIITDRCDRCNSNATDATQIRQTQQNSKHSPLTNASTTKNMSKEQQTFSRFCELKSWVLDVTCHASH